MAVTCPDFIVKDGQWLLYKRPPWREPELPLSSLPLSIIFENDSVLIVNKPSGIPVLPGGRYYEHTLVRILRKQRNLSEDSFLSPVHRLGRGTSGALLFAKVSI